VPRRFYIRVLGCAKNLIDAENLCGRLLERGWLLTNDPEEAEMLILATCSFIEEAREEARRAYRALVRIKRRRRVPLVLTGCHPPYHMERCGALFPEADCILPPWRAEEFVDVADSLLLGERHDLSSPPPKEAPADDSRLLLTPAHLAFLRISDGCSNTCTFCTIPRIRGRHRPKTAHQIIAEARLLASLGVKELVLIAQDTTAWFCPQTGMRLPALLENLDGVEGFEWIRLMYAHPARITGRLVRALSACRRVLPYIDLPIQHISDGVLRRMGRAGGRRAVLKALELLKSLPDVCIRTTVMVGFPGETEAEFEELLAFLKEAGFCRIGVFGYSAERGTKAASYEQLPKDLVKRRLRRTRRLASSIMLSLHRRLVGRVERVVVDWVEQGRSVCRSWRDAPQVDGLVVVEQTLKPGEFVRVRFDAAKSGGIIASLQGKTR